LAAAISSTVGCHQPVEQAFAYSTDAPSRAGLLSTPRGVVVANDFGVVALVDGSGTPLWRVTACREVLARPALAHEVVVVACSGGEWVGLDLADGKERWRSAPGARISIPLAADSERAFGLDQEGTVWACDAATGAFVWHRATSELRPTKERRVFAAPVAWQGLVVASLAEAGLQAFDTAKGTLRWRQPTRGLTGLLSLEDRLLVLWPSGKIGALRGDGTWAWTREVGAPALSGPSLAEGLAWVSLEGNALVGVSLEDGTEKARFSLPAPALGRIASVEHLIAVPTSGVEGRLVAFRLGDPHFVFSARADSPLRTDALVLDGLVVVAPADGRVLAFRPTAPGNN
jgi:outer membrane protein assembly factor BamB